METTVVEVVAFRTFETVKKKTKVHVVHPGN